MTERTSRRGFVRVAGAAGVAALAGCLAGGNEGDETDPGPSGDGEAADDLPLTGTPPVVDLAEQGYESTLRVVGARHRIVTEEAAGDPVELPRVWAWQADDHRPSVPGPRFTVPEGETFSIRLENTHERPHTLHVHAVQREWEDDGAPIGGAPYVTAGEDHVYDYVADVPGTHLYHCHVQTDSHLDMGMYGILHVVPEDDDPPDREYFFTLRDWDTRLHRREAGEDVEYDPRERSSNEYTINGRAAPSTFHPELGSPIVVSAGERVRVHLVNAGYQSHPFHTHAHRFEVVAKDGTPVPEAARHTEDVTNVAPAERVTIEFEADADPGIYPAHCHRANHVTTQGSYPGGMATAIVYEEAMDTEAFADVAARAGFEA